MAGFKPCVWRGKKDGRIICRKITRHDVYLNDTPIPEELATADGFDVHNNTVDPELCDTCPVSFSLCRFVIFDLRIVEVYECEDDVKVDLYLKGKIKGLRDFAPLKIRKVEPMHTTCKISGFELVPSMIDMICTEGTICHDFDSIGAAVKRLKARRAKKFKNS